MRNRDKANLALIATNIFFAVNFTAIKLLINKSLIQPFALNLVRIAGCVLLLWLLVAIKKTKTRIHKKDAGRFVACAFTGVALNQMLFIKGLSITYSIHASLLMLTTPILITIFAATFLNERLNMNKTGGILLGLTGAFILITSKSRSGDSVDVLLGNVLILLNAVSYTVFFILVKPLMTKYRSLTVVRMIFTIGLFMVLPFSWKEFEEIPWQLYTLNDALILAFVVICGTLLAYAFNVYGIKILGATVAGTYIYSQPFFAAVVAMLVLGERLTFSSIIAAVLIFAGVYLANKRSRHG